MLDLLSKNHNLRENIAGMTANSKISGNDVLFFYRDVNVYNAGNDNDIILPLNNYIYMNIFKAQ